MQQITEGESTTNSVLNAFVGMGCSFCDEGELVRSTYKGNDAVICDECETPGAQLW